MASRGNYNRRKRFIVQPSDEHRREFGVFDKHMGIVVARRLPRSKARQVANDYNAAYKHGELALGYAMRASANSHLTDQHKRANSGTRGE